ncbi:DUF928 domain-containing protein [Stenomitos frigidus]|uniref:DUF928 domain-containing protein n=1 Tax=Stenomitos frigidus ULC18 TaxID=2107698 RepID=A0A2T1ENN8_9CYAN|nr:DUF928 domain-containing protein [Stenomitos frigidus]PSB34359.1 hypothetical protein C7B82_02505 [Stenomitos frigidus ULC18]
MARPTLKRWHTLLSYLLVLALMESVIIAPQPAVGFDLFGRIRSIFVPRRSVGVARGRRTGAAVRDPDLCRPVELPLTALVPDTDEPAKTIAEYPTFWFYVPYTLTPSTAAASQSSKVVAPTETYTLKFVLQDEQHHDVYQTTFALPETSNPGVLSLRFLSPKAALETGKKYRWYFLVYCNDREEIYEPAFVEGLIQREALSNELKNKIEREEPQNRFLVYAEARLWSDTLAALDADRSRVGSTVQSTWAAVLERYGLNERISQQPIIGHYYVPPKP